MRVEKALKILKAQENTQEIDIPKMIEDAICVLVYLRNQYEREYRKTGQNHEMEVFWETQNVKNTHNTWSHLGLSLAGAVLTGASGAASFRGNKVLAKGLSALGQGGSSTSHLAENQCMGQRVIYQNRVESNRQLRSRDDEDARGEREAVQNAMRTLDSVMQSMQRAREQILTR